MGSIRTAIGIFCFNPRHVVHAMACRYGGDVFYSFLTMGLLNERQVPRGRPMSLSAGDREHDPQCFRAGGWGTKAPERRKIRF